MCWYCMLYTRRFSSYIVDRPSNAIINTLHLGLEGTMGSTEEWKEWKEESEKIVP